MSRRSSLTAIIVVLIIGALLIPTPVAQAAYSDLPPDHWALAELADLLTRGIISGYPDGTVRPDAPITRAEFVALINRTAHVTAQTYEGGFPDVTATDWFASGVAAATKIGYIRGDDQGRFLPNQPLTRYEAAVIIDRILGLPEAAAPSYTDAADIPSWAAGSVAAVSAAGYLKGYPDGSFSGQNRITRAEAAVLIRRTEAPMVDRMPRFVLLYAACEQGTMTDVTFAVRPYGTADEYTSADTTGEQAVTMMALRPGTYEGWAFDELNIGHRKFTVPTSDTSINIAVGQGDLTTGLSIDGSWDAQVGQAMPLTIRINHQLASAAPAKYRIALNIYRTDETAAETSDLELGYLDPADNQLHDVAFTQDGDMLTAQVEPGGGLTVAPGLTSLPLQVTVNRAGTYQIDAYLWTTDDESMLGRPSALVITAPTPAVMSFTGPATTVTGQANEYTIELRDASNGLGQGAALGLAVSRLQGTDSGSVEAEWLNPSTNTYEVVPLEIQEESGVLFGAIGDGSEHTVPDDGSLTVTVRLTFADSGVYSVGAYAIGTTDGERLGAATISVGVN